MKNSNRIYAVILVLVMLAFTILQGYKQMNSVQEYKEGKEGQRETLTGSLDKDTLYLWYTDETLTDYLNSCALSYMQEHEDVRIVPTLVSPVEYLENIQKETINADNGPDLYIVTNDCLRKAELAGIADQITDPDKLFESDMFPRTAIDAVTCEGKTVAYPLYYETSVLMYNKTDLDIMFKQSIQEEDPEGDGEYMESAENTADQSQSEDRTVTDGQSQTEGDVQPENQVMQEEQSQIENQDQTVSDNSSDDTESANENYAEKIVPASFEDMLSFANQYDAPEGIENILEWDVSDIFYTYFFAGNYMNVGGRYGDDKTQIDIFNDQSVQCLSMYQSLNQFFSIDATQTSYNQVLDHFADGQTLFTIVTTDAIARMEQEQKDGRFTQEFAVMPLPDVSSALQSRGLSVTNAIAINGFGKHKKSANEVASWISSKTDGELYMRTGKLAANQKTEYEDANLDVCLESYKQSISLPKLMQASNFWLQLEKVMTDVWNGENVENALEELQNQIESQLN